METQQVISWKPEYNLDSTDPSLKKTFASAVATIAANKARQLQSQKDLEIDQANKYAQENSELYKQFQSLSDRGGKIRKRRATKHRKTRRKGRKTKRNYKRRKM